MNEVFYCDDLEGLKEGLVSLGYYDFIHKNFTVPYMFTDILKVGNESLSYVKDIHPDVRELPMLHSLGSYEDLEANTNPDNTDIYKRLRYYYDAEAPFKLGEFYE